MTDNIRVVFPEFLLTDKNLSPTERLIGIYIFAHPERIVPRDIICTFAASKNTVTKTLNKFWKVGLLDRTSRYEGWTLSKRYAESANPSFGDSNPSNWETNPRERETNPSFGDSAKSPKDEKERSKEREESLFVEEDSIYNSSLDKNEASVESKAETENIQDKQNSMDKGAGGRDPQRGKDITEVIDYLNAKTGKRYSSKSENNRKHINARMEEGYAVADFKSVIDRKVSEWKDTKMDKYLRPETLFSGKFDRYVNEGSVGSSGRTPEEEATWKEIWGDV